MTATAHITIQTPIAREPARAVDGSRMIVRGVQRLFGAALTLVAVGVWLGPGASWESDMMLIKLLLSVIAVLAGFGLMQASATPAAPVVEIDTIRREVRLVRRGFDGAMHVIQRSAFGDLSHADRDGRILRLWAADQILLAEVELSDDATLSSLLAGLRDAGKID